MARPVSNLRLFVGVYPPHDLASALLERVGMLNLPQRTRLTPLEQVHLTLQFIGDMPVAEMDATCESIERATSGIGAFTLNLQGLIVLPEHGPARLVAAKTDAPPPLLELHARLVQRFARRARERHDNRYLPHITLCRFDSPVHRLTIEDESLHGSWRVERVSLMRSTLTQHGSKHHEVAVFMLASQQ